MGNPSDNKRINMTHRFIQKYIVNKVKSTLPILPTTI